MALKQGTRSTMPVTITGIDAEDVARIEFVFRDGPDYRAKLLKAAEYPTDVVPGQDPGVYLIPWTAQETYQFDTGGTFYMDTRIHPKSTEDMPNTPIIKLTMDRTLFAPEEDDG